MLVVGKFYRLKFPGVAARVIEPPAGQASPEFSFLVESLFLRSRWYVNGKGDPDNLETPALILPDLNRPKPLRRALATPFYLLALIFDLLCSGLTAIAAAIAGDPP